MHTEKVTVETRIFRSWLVPGALVLCILAAVLGIFGVGAYIDPAYRAYLLQDLIDSEVFDASARNTYFTINAVLTVLTAVLPGILAGCLGVSLLGKPARGLGALSTVAQWMVRGINLVGICLGVLFVGRAAVYTIGCLQINGGAYLLFAMVISEAVMGGLAALLFVNLRKFINCLCDTSASMAYTFATGKLDTHAIPAFTATGFLLLGISCLVLALDQLFTLTVIYDLHPYYKVLVSPHMAQWATAGSFLCGAGANVLLYVYLRNYKRICERLLFQQRRKILGTDQ